MGRALVIFILICFAASFVNNSYSKTMLSLENGSVYTEEFDLNHILQAKCTSQAKSCQDRQSILGSGQSLCHRHVQLTSYYIPENSDGAAAAKYFLIGIDSLPADRIILTASAVESAIKRCTCSGRFILPIPTLQQSSVLLL